MRRLLGRLRSVLKQDRIRLGLTDLPAAERPDLRLLPGDRLEVVGLLFQVHDEIPVSGAFERARRYRLHEVDRPNAPDAWQLWIDSGLLLESPESRALFLSPESITIYRPNKESAKSRGKI